MSTIITRTGKGSALEWEEVDANFTNLNADKVEKTAADITGGTINGTSIGATTPSTVTATTLVVNDNTTLGSSNTDTINFVGRVNSDFEPATDNTYDLGRVGHEWRNLYIDGTANIDNLVADTAAITGGTIDNTVIGGTTPAAGTFTTLTANSTSQFGRGLTSYVQADGGATPYVLAQGAANANLTVGSNGTGTLFLRTNGGGTTQAAVSHTASAVNYVQVTGAATGSGPTISAQGSDANAFLAITSKGTSAIRLQTGGSNQVLINNTTSAINQIGLTGSTAGVAPQISTQGTDTNIDLALTPKGTGTVVANGPFTATGQTSLGGAAGSESLRVLTPGLAGNYAQINTNSFGDVIYGNAGSGANIPNFFLTKGTGVHRFATNTSISNEQFRVSHTASAVNFVQVTGAATGGNVIVSAQGSDANVGLNLTPKGTGVVRAFGGLYINEAGAAASGQRLQITTGGAGAVFNQADNSSMSLRVNSVNALEMPFVASAVNFLQLNNAPTGTSVRLNATGTDSNVSLALIPRGTGAINLAPGSSGVNISNGGAVTALTRTAQGSGYTSFPSVAISAPTTAGGVQATATVTNMFASGVTVQSGGTGYTVGNVLTVSGGTPQTAVQLTVSTVSGGVITAVTVSNAGAYTALPTNPVSVTGGTGSGATFNLTWAVIAFTITNAGSGYVEQPTVTFSGGGGSGAAAYAVVGAGTIIRALGATGTQTIDFAGPNYISASIPMLRLRDIGTSDTFVQIVPNVSYTQVLAQGNSNATLALAANGSGRVSIQTNGTSQTEQLRIAHTASAVNFVQVTGAVTGASGTISSQGSDANIGLNITTKGTFGGVFRNSAGSIVFSWDHSNTATQNYLASASASVGSAPSLSSKGTDTNIDLTLVPKGTGNVRFGTFTADMTLVVQGFIEVKDSGGTIRKLAVIA
jgi:phosphotransferase system HPr-like phosphotransfer protein